MDKEEAARILARELVRLNGQKFIVNPAYQKYTLEKAIAIYEVEYEKPFSLQACVGDLNRLSDEDFTNFIKNYKSRVTRYCSKVEDANYVFTERLEDLSQTRSSYGTLYSYFTFTNTFSFFALIGEKEVKNLKRLFYKDVKPDIVSAMNALDIKHFVNDYKIYKDSNNLDKWESLKVCQNFVKLVSKFEYDKDGEVGISRFEPLGGIDALNKCIKELGIESYLSTTEDRSSSARTWPDFVHKNNISRVVNKLYDLKIMGYESKDGINSDFFNFVFSLPYEEQNIEFNKNILSQNDFDYKHVLIKEYSNGKYFQEYFDCLSNEKQKELVSVLEGVSKNLIHNSFLWSKGFKNIDMDHLALYKENTEGFIDYFRNKTVEEKRIILKDIIEYDFVNEEVVKWLNENELDLIREVGLNG